MRTHCKNGHPFTDGNIFMDGKSRRCKACAVEKATAWRVANPERHRENQRRAQRAYVSRNPDVQRATQLKAKYGITIADFDAMFAAQNGCCKVCDVKLDVYTRFVSESPVNKATTAHIDHCHSTGRVRGLLCLRCNSAVGYLKDCPERARRLAQYLEAGREGTDATPGDTVGCVRVLASSDSISDNV